MEGPRVARLQGKHLYNEMVIFEILSLYQAWVSAINA